MVEVAQFIATLCCLIFPGAALYINLVEHPARMSCDTRTAVMVWRPSYERATLMQAPLAILSCFAGLVSWLSGGGLFWLVAAVLIGAVAPFTYIVIMPVNKRLMLHGEDFSLEDPHGLLGK